MDGLQRLAHLQLSDGDLVVDLFFIPSLILGDGDVGEHRLKLQNLLHLQLRGGPLTSQQHPQLHHVVQVGHQNLLAEQDQTAPHQQTAATD